MKRRIALITWPLAGLLSACSAPLPPIQSLSDARPGEVIVVGRVELYPPLEKNDQVLDGFNSDQAKNKVYLNTTAELVEEGRAPSIGREFIEDVVGEPFYVRHDNQPFFVQDATIYTYVGRGTDIVKLPGHLKINLQGGDRAVYIGTLRYTRNEYFDITKAEIVDDYDRTNAAFRKKFGASFNLRRAIAIPVKAAK